MGKFRIKKVSAKGKRWKKGHSSSSNPETVKHRLLAKSRFSQEHLGGGNLTTDALKKHDAYLGTKESDMEDDIESSGKTFKTFASDWSACSNVSFNRFLARFQADSALHKEMLAVLAAVTEIIKSYKGRESSVEYFAAMMSMLEKVETEESTTAVLSLIAMNIKNVPQSILRAKFSEISKLFVELLEKYSGSADNTIMRAIIGCLSVILRAQDASVWNYSSTIQIFDSILAFIIHSKPKVRKAAQHAICAILKGSFIMINNETKAPSHHPAAKHTAKYCIHLIETSGSLGGGTTTLHILNLWKDILDTFPQSQLKAACETILKVMTLGDTRVTSCGLQALHGLFKSKPSEESLPGQLNAQLIAAFFDYQPSSTDLGPCLAWMSVMQEAFNNLSRVDPSLCLGNLPRLFSVCTQLWLSEQPEIRGGATHCMESVAQAALGPVPVSTTVYESALQKVVVHVSAGLSYQYHSSWAQVIHVIGTLFEVVGKENGKFLIPCLRTLGDLHDSHQFSYARELEFTIGKAIRCVGPQVVLHSIPLHIGGKDTNYEFKRSWMLPVLRDNVHGAELKFYIDFFLPLAIQCRNLSTNCDSNNDKIGAHSYDLLQTQLWSLLPSFCNNPPDIKDNFKKIAKLLGSIISDCKELRLPVMTALRKLITCAIDNGKQEDISELSRFAKNYLPLLFNLYTIQPKGSDEEGQRLAAFETIKVYLKITPPEFCLELFDRASQKLESDVTPFKKESLLDLLRVLLPFQTEERLYSLYERCKKTIPMEKDKHQQKKAYRLLEELCSSGSSTCKSFVSNNFVDLTNLLLGALSKSSPSSKGPRLRCLIHLVRHLDNSQSDLLHQIVPEAILCCKDINERCRTAAYGLLGEIGETMLRWKNKPSEDIIRDYMGILMLGLAGQPKMVACSLLALTKVTHQFREYIPEDLLKQMLHNVLLLIMSPTREIVDAALSYVKMFVTLGTSIVTASLSSIVKSFVGMTEDCKRHFRIKTRNLLDRFVRKYGYDDIAAIVPADDDTMHKRLKNLHRLQVRKLKERAKYNHDSDEDVDNQFSLKSQPKSIEEILAESDDSDLDVEPIRNSDTKNKKKLSTWIKEDENSIIDFTDSSAARKLTATNPKSKAIIEERKQKEKKSDFKVASDGRLIITDIDEEKNIASMKNMKLENFSGSDYEDDGSESIMGSQITRKRKASVSSEPPNKYKAGGSGIHRPIKKAVKKGTGNNGMVSGSEYRSKKAGGDVKRKGMPDPYAYVPLSRKFLNRRKKAKRSGQFASIVKGAVKGAAKGSKSKTKVNKRKH